MPKETALFFVNLCHTTMFFKKYSVACLFLSPQKLRREAVGTLAFQPMGSGLAAAFYMETHSPLSARQLLNWWEKE